MSMKKNIAVIGAGHWGKNLVRNFHDLGGLYAVCDKNLTHAKKMASQYSCLSLDWGQVLENKVIEAVVIAAPAAFHYTLCKEALMAGKHVFIEKPLALQVANAQEIYEIAKEKKRCLMVGHLLQYHPVFLELQRIVKDGQLGRLQYIYSNRLNLGKIRREEDILWSFAPHDISMILSLVDENPEDVDAQGSYYLHESIADVTTTHMKFPSGVHAHVFVSWLHPYKEQKLIVVGDKGMVVFDENQPWDKKLGLYRHHIEWKDDLPVPNKADIDYIPVPEKEPLKEECRHFMSCINDGLTPKTDGREGLRVLKVLELASHKLKEKIEPAQKKELFVHESASIDENVAIGRGTKIWHFSHVLSRSVIGKNCVIGQNVSIGPDVNVGNGCKIQNNVSLYKGVTLEENVFCGPSCVFTNVNNPRADIDRKKEFCKTHVEQGVTIGANATVVCGVRLGKYSFIGAGAVVTKDVKAHALMLGNPAKQKGWVSKAGEVLTSDLICPRDGTAYFVNKVNRLEAIEGQVCEA